jgi:predicted unusual protein kinase regulating ubiquinone biosynthesis (AarF/ABC1/UbiB family)
MEAPGKPDSSAKDSSARDPTLRPAIQPSSDDARSAHLSRHAREREIASVLTRHGIRLLGHILASERPAARKHGEVIPQDRGDIAKAAGELRLALEELGPTFIKLGQLLSTRADLLPLEYRREVTKLQDAAPPSPPEAIRERLESELTGGIAGAFADFDPQPLAAGRWARRTPPCSTTEQRLWSRSAGRGSWS